MRLPKQASGVCRSPRPSCSSTSEEQGLDPQGTCGSGWNEPWIRDRYGNADFTEPCRTHDRCYDTCGRTKDDCDSEFHAGMRERCRRAYPSQWHVIQRRACLETANTYYSAVHRMGGDAYRAAQRASMC